MWYNAKKINKKEGKKLAIEKVREYFRPLGMEDQIREFEDVYKRQIQSIFC